MFQKIPQSLLTLMFDDPELLALARLFAYRKHLNRFFTKILPRLALYHRSNPELFDKSTIPGKLLEEALTAFFENGNTDTITVWLDSYVDILKERNRNSNEKGGT